MVGLLYIRSDLLALSVKPDRRIVIHEVEDSGDLPSAAVDKVADTGAVFRGVQFGLADAGFLHEIPLGLQAESLVSKDAPTESDRPYPVALTDAAARVCAQSSVPVEVSTQVVPEQFSGQKVGPFEHEGFSGANAVLSKPFSQLRRGYDEFSHLVAVVGVVRNGVSALQGRPETKEVISIFRGESKLEHRSTCGDVAISGHHSEPIRLFFGVDHVKEGVVTRVGSVSLGEGAPFDTVPFEDFVDDSLGAASLATDLQATITFEVAAAYLC